MSNIKELSTVSDVSFIDNLALENIRDEVANDYIANLGTATVTY